MSSIFVPLFSGNVLKKKKSYIFIREIVKEGLCPKYNIVNFTMAKPGRPFQISFLIFMKLMTATGLTS